MNNHTDSKRKFALQLFLVIKLKPAIMDWNNVQIFPILKELPYFKRLISKVHIKYQSLLMFSQKRKR